MLKWWRFQTKFATLNRPKTKFQPRRIDVGSFRREKKYPTVCLTLAVKNGMHPECQLHSVAELRRRDYGGSSLADVLGRMYIDQITNCRSDIFNSIGNFISITLFIWELTISLLISTSFLNSLACSAYSWRGFLARHLVKWCSRSFLYEARPVKFSERLDNF